MIPPPTGFRRPISQNSLKAKRPPPKGGGRPLSPHLWQPPTAALGVTQSPSGSPQVGGLASQEVVG